MKKNFKSQCIGFAVCLLFSIFFCYIYIYDNEKIELVTDYNIIDENSNYIIIIDEIRKEGNYYNIYGCFIELGYDTEYINNYFVLINDLNQVFKVSTVMVKRESATQYFNDGHNYDNSGLIGQIKENKIKDSNYKVGVITQKNGVKYLKISDYIFNK